MRSNSLITRFALRSLAESFCFADPALREESSDKELLATGDASESAGGASFDLVSRFEVGCILEVYRIRLGNVGGCKDDTKLSLEIRRQLEYSPGQSVKGQIRPPIQEGYIPLFHI